MHVRRVIELFAIEEDIIESEVENQIVSCGIKSKLLFQTNKMNKCFGIATGNDSKSFCKIVIEIKSCCQDVVELIKDLKLPIVGPRLCDLTHAGPGVGVQVLRLSLEMQSFAESFTLTIEYETSRGQRTG